MSAPAPRAAVRLASASAAASGRPLTIALLGFGRIGSAIAHLSRCGPDTSLHRFRIAGALVREPSRPRQGRDGIGLTRDADELFGCHPDVVVEALGGIEPARTLVRAALERRLPVVTANKALVAWHGPELLDVALRSRTSFRYEASVLAGVPFLGTFAARPLAARVSALAGILNGTSNFILTRVASAGTSVDCAVREAQQLGLAEPDPSDDLSGADAAHKLAVLAWHFGLGSLAPDAIDTTGIEAVNGDDAAIAREFGGSIKPVAWLSRHGGRTVAFVGPALVPWSHHLAHIDGAENAVQLETESGRLFFAGPGAGPVATATTMLDDVVEAARGAQDTAPRCRQPLSVAAPATPWLVRLDGPGLPSGEDLAACLGWYSIWNRRSITRAHTAWLLTYPCERDRLGAALRVLSLATGCCATTLRVLEG